MLGAIGLVVAASVVIQITTDDGDDTADPASTTLDLDTAAPVPTAPPQTLDVGALGDFDMPETRYPPMVSAPTPLQQQIPGFPVVPGSANEDLSGYDLDAAVANNVLGADPQRSMFNIVGSDLTGSVTTGGTVAPPLRATAASEPGSARDALDGRVRRRQVALCRRPRRAGRVHPASAGQRLAGRSNHRC